MNHEAVKAQRIVDTINRCRDVSKLNDGELSFLEDFNPATCTPEELITLCKIKDKLVS